MTGPAPVLVRADDGAELALWRHAPAGDAPARRTPLLLVHGTFSNRMFFGGRWGMAQYLAERGYDAWVGELRGRQAVKAGAWSFEDWIVYDAPALLRALQDATGAATIGWIGHSAGAVIAAGCAARSDEVARRFAGIVLAAAPAPHRPGPWHTAVAILGDAVSRLAGRLPARALGIGPADEPPGILRQWSRWNRDGRWTGRDGFDYVAGARRVMAPALAVAGAADILAPPAACRTLLEAFGSPDRTLEVCGKKQGYAHDYTHNRLVISSSARQDVWPVIARWLEARIP